MKKFSLFDNIQNNLKTIEDIDNSIKITLGPTGKNGIVSNQKSELKFLTTGALLLKSLEFSNSASVLPQQGRHSRSYVRHFQTLKGPIR